MSQNIYDNDTFFEGYSQLTRSQFGLDGAPEWESLERQLPDLCGLSVVDLGCGYGWFCRIALDKGAKTVTGLDISKKMLETAKGMTPTCMAERIDYVQADLDDFSLPGSYNFAYSSLTLHYIVDIERFFKTVYQALVPGGYFLFSIAHPIFTAPARQSWHVDAEGRKSWPVNGYQHEGRRVSNWIVDGVVRQHRTLGTYVNTLLKLGFTLKHLEEWAPSAEQLAYFPALAEDLERPMFAIIKVQR